MVKRLSNLSYIERVERLQRLNQNLVDVLSLTTYELIQYAKKHNIELPYKIESLLKQSLLYIDELKNPTNITERCTICNKLNPENAEFCAYCGTPFMDITRVRQRDKSPDDATEPELLVGL